MLAGLPVHLKQSFYLQEAETYYYLNQGGNCEIQGKDDGDDFRRLVVAMEILSFSQDDQTNAFRVLASILHLGNVFFHRVEVGGQEGAGVVSAQEIRVVAELLSISPEALQKALTYKVTDAMREKIYTPLSVESAVDARDAVAKILYSLLFNWLTERINGRVYPRHEAPSIAILDIYGFEDLLFNSFEQLCINYANETLQSYFTRIIFRQEQEEYFREQISWTELSFTDNQSCIDLIAAKPHGILRILDDQNGFPQATDHTFLQKCHYHHGNNELYSRPKMPQPEFTIKHYAGRVTYQVQKFLDKNFDQLRQEVLDLFVQSRNTDPGFFDMELVATQLRYLGILDTIRIRKEGYPIRIHFHIFLHRYKSLLGLKEAPHPDGEQCVKMLRKLCPIRKGSYQVGVTKIFLKEDLYMLLESKRDRMLHLAALILQRCVRMHFARVKFLRLRRRILLLQARCRGYLTRLLYLQMRVNLIRFRSLVQLCANRQRYMRANVLQKRRAEQQRLSREIINVSQLPVPAELHTLLHNTTVGKELHSDCLALVEAPRVEGTPQLTLPLDVNNYLMTKYIRSHFRELKFGMLMVPLEHSLTRLEEDLKQDAQDVFILILRFMGDPNLNGAQENLFGNYIIQRALATPPIRDELLAQLANQVWRNQRDVNAERGWLLLAACFSAFCPSDSMAKYLLKFVSDYALDGYKALCQHKLLQALQKSHLGPDGARSFPPSLLEWTTARRKAHMLLLIHCTDGVSCLCALHSWSSGEELAGAVLEQRGVSSMGRHGWSLRLQEAGHWVEIGGHDYVLDVVSEMELPHHFPKQKSYFLISTDQFTQPRPNASMYVCVCVCVCV
ncbi:hypothetical protein ACEWY4_027811 [Coilia grayii]|uniref:Uncharacterized protein n=1 Tax=Coilia grayii TaxID=363190 RepID=A0ABD1INK9_9TELE